MADDRMREGLQLADEGTELMKSGDYPAAAKKLLAAVQINERDWTTWQHLGLCLLQLKQPEHAVVAFRNSTALNPGFAQAWNNLGTVLAMLNDWDAAANAFEAGIAADPRYAKNHFGRGNAYLMAGDKDKARTSFQQALAIDPGYALAHQALANL